MKSYEASNYFFLNKSTYINLRWIAIIGQLFTINVVALVFKFEFNFLLANFVVFIGIISNFSLFFFHKSTQLSNQTSLIYLLIDILQLSFLLYLSGGILNPFSIFLIIPSVFASSNLDTKTNFLLILVTIISICILTLFHKDLPGPLSDYSLSNYYYYSIPIGLVIALIFLNYFAILFGKENKIRKEALDKIQEVIAKEHELVSLGGQAAAAAHSLGTPLSTIKLVSQELFNQLNENKDIKKDLELLVSQVKRCDDILKKLTLNPNVEDDFIEKDLSLSSYINQIAKSYEQISSKKFLINLEQDTNPFPINKSIELVYGIRNFIGNANKFSRKYVYISILSDSQSSEINIEDDGDGFPKEILSKIGEPYIKSIKKKYSSKAGLGLGIFIGKTLLEKNYAEIIFRNSETRSGAEINIKWKNSDLKRI
tara:strand:- start:1376 stop:2653 length:1278 start_codon:yes stop_codon:yes gene_type:complete